MDRYHYLKLNKHNELEFMQSSFLLHKNILNTILEFHVKTYPFNNKSLIRFI